MRSNFIPTKEKLIYKNLNDDFSIKGVNKIPYMKGFFISTSKDLRYQ